MFAHTNKIFYLVRFPNLLIIFFTQFFIKFLIIDQGVSFLASITDKSFLLLCLSTIVIASAGYIINDYYDIKIDLVNKPERVLVGKYFSRRTALILHLTLSTLGVFIGFSLSLLVGFIHLISVYALWLYSNKLKRLPLYGNIVIAFLTGLSIFLLAIFYRKEYYMISVYAVFACYISLIREIIKDLEDVKGDAAFGCRTLPLAIGFRKTKKLILIIIVLFIINIFAIMPFFALPVAIYWLLLVVIPLGGLFFKLYKSDTLNDFKYLSLYCKMIMLSGIGSLLFIDLIF
jgi:4-hydroxybenzoate polyprenyltransferase